jgi:hypothetical protein
MHSPPASYLLPLYRRLGLLPPDTPFNRRAAEYARIAARDERNRKHRELAKAGREKKATEENLPSPPTVSGLDRGQGPRHP